MKNPLLVVSLVLLLCFTFGCQNKAEKAELEKFRTRAKVEEQNMELFRRMVEEWNKGNYEYLKAAFATDYAYYFPSASPKPMSSEENIEEIRKIREGFPDIIWTIEDMVAVGDMVIARNLFSGTHKGNYFGIAPTGTRIEVSSIMMVRIRNGKFSEKREELNALPLMLQLGMELKPKGVEKK